MDIKRDARIGLAIVLVLGLTVTLLVARAIHTKSVAQVESEIAADKPEAANSGVQKANTAPVAEDPAGSVEQNQALRDFTARNGGSSWENQGPAGEVVDLPAMNQPAHAQPVAHPGSNSTSSSPGAALPPLAFDAAPPTNSEATIAVDASKTYTVVAGDTFGKISTKVFGTAKYAGKIGEANPGVDASKLKVNQVLKMPAIHSASEVPAVKSTGTKTAVVSHDGTSEPVAASKPVAKTTSTNSLTADDSVKTHVVASGETLAVIAKEHYGLSGPKTIQKIVSANPGLDPNKLHVGATLKLPGATQ